MKTKSDSSIECCKAKLVEREISQKYKGDFDKT